MILFQTTSNQEEANMIKINIGNIANALQEQSEKLTNYKAQQQGLLRDSFRK